MRETFRALRALAVIGVVWPGTIFLWYILTSHDYEKYGAPYAGHAVVVGLLLGLGLAHLLTRETNHRPKLLEIMAAKKDQASAPRPPEDPS